MNQRLQLGLLSAVLLCAVPLSAPAQTGRSAPRVSHVPIQDDFSPDSADAYLNNRLEEKSTAAILNDMVSNAGKYHLDAIDQAILSAFADDPQKALNNPEVRKIIDKVQKDPKKYPNISAENREKLKEFVKKYPPPKPNNSQSSDTPRDNPSPPPSGDSTKALPDTHKKSSETPPQTTQTTPQQNPPASANPPSPSPVDNNMREVAEWLADSRFADSPAFRRMVLNLDRLHVPEAPGVSSWDRRLERIGDRFANVGSHLPDISWPKFGSSSHGPSRRGPAIAPPDTSESGNAILFALLGVAAAALFIWAVLRRPALGLLLGRTAKVWRLGPWPVRPEAVRTREELIRAFEISGPVAFRFGRTQSESSGDRRPSGAARWRWPEAAAERLAGLYEQARYAPPDEALPDGELVAARADLSLLAGVAAA